MGTQRRCLENSLDRIQQAIRLATENAPTNKVLVQQLDTLDKIWGDYLDAYNKLSCVVSQAILMQLSKNSTMLTRSRENWLLFTWPRLELPWKLWASRTLQPCSGQTGWASTSFQHAGGGAGRNLGRCKGSSHPSQAHRKAPYVYQATQEVELSVCQPGGAG